MGQLPPPLIMPDASTRDDRHTLTPSRPAGSLGLVKRPKSKASRTPRPKTSAGKRSGSAAELQLQRLVEEQAVRIRRLEQRDAELPDRVVASAEATLRFTGGAQLPIKARLRGELNRRIVIRDASGRPARMSSYVQGLVELDNTDGHPIFRGH